MTTRREEAIATAIADHFGQLPIGPHEQVVEFGRLIWSAALAVVKELAISGVRLDDGRYDTLVILKKDFEELSK